MSESWAEAKARELYGVWWELGHKPSITIEETIQRAIRETIEEAARRCEVGVCPACRDTPTHTECTWLIMAARHVRRMLTAEKK